MGFKMERKMSKYASGQRVRLNAQYHSTCGEYGTLIYRPWNSLTWHIKLDAAFQDRHPYGKVWLDEQDFAPTTNTGATS